MGPDGVDRVALMNAMMAAIVLYGKLVDEFNAVEDKVQWLSVHELELKTAASNVLAAVKAYDDS